MVETSLMLFYVSEANLTEEEWNLRKRVLDIHDCVTRYRMFKSWKQKEQASGFRRALEELRQELHQHEKFQRLDQKKRDDLLSGKILYLDGLRSVVRSAEWDVDMFDATYAYLSSHTHSAPVSYYRVEEQGIYFDEPSDHQYVVAALCLSVADETLGSACKRILDLFPHTVEGFADWLAARRSKEEAGATGEARPDASA
jgi:hypothetical protein